MPGRRGLPLQFLRPGEPLLLMSGSRFDTFQVSSLLLFLVEQENTQASAVPPCMGPTAQGAGSLGIKGRLNRI